MDEIRDSRHMHGLPLDAQPGDVRERWLTHAAIMAARRGGFAARPSHAQLEETHVRVAAYVSDSRWVADCPACNGGVACWPEMSDGCCFDCGRIYEIVFPKDWRKGVALLELRPQHNRHWLPGESIDTLKLENLTRGIAIVTRKAGE